MLMASWAEVNVQKTPRSSERGNCMGGGDHPYACIAVHHIRLGVPFRLYDVRMTRLTTHIGHAVTLYRALHCFGGTL